MPFLAVSASNVAQGGHGNKHSVISIETAGEGMDSRDPYNLLSQMGQIGESFRGVCESRCHRPLVRKPEGSEKCLG